MPDLPVPGSEDEAYQWGNLLVTWLEHDHNTDATHKTVVVCDDDVVCVDDDIVILED